MGDNANESLRHIKRDGWVELQEFIPEILCDDGSMHCEDPLKTFVQLGNDGLRRLGFTPPSMAGMQEALVQAGYKNIECLVTKVPISIWPQDRKLKTAGVLMKSILADKIESIAAKPLVALDITPEDRKRWARQAGESLENNRIHRYVHYCIVAGQKCG